MTDSVADEAASWSSTLQQLRAKPMSLLDLALMPGAARRPFCELVVLWAANTGTHYRNDHIGDRIVRVLTVAKIDVVAEVHAVTVRQVGIVQRSMQFQQHV